MIDRQLLRRAWDALDSFKQAYPENWSDEDEQVLKDLMAADVNPRFQALTTEEVNEAWKLSEGAKDRLKTYNATLDDMLWRKNKLRQYKETNEPIPCKTD